MADTVVHMGENSPEYVAYKLLVDIANVENKTLHRGNEAATREYILTTYAQCFRVVRGLDPVKRQ